jgi:Skp family chaperone for outer membrane proteins
MKYTVTLLAAALAGLLPVSAQAQDAAAPPAVAQSAAAPVAPSAYPAKIALVAFEQAVIATNEGQKTLADLQKKYEPQKAKIDALATEIDTLKKQLQAAPAGQTDAQRAAKLKEIDAKDKELQNASSDASNAYNSEVQQALSRIMQKVNVVMQEYVKKNGYTLLLDVGGQQSPVMWTAPEPNADITQAVVEAYNVSSGVAAPPPAAPTPSASPAKPTAPAKSAPSTPAKK